MRTNSHHRSSHARFRAWTFIAPASVLAAILAAPLAGQESRPSTPPGPVNAPRKTPEANPSNTLTSQPNRVRQAPTETAPVVPNRAVNPAAGPNGAPVSQTSAPVIKFDPEVLDFGEMTAGIASTLKVKLVNIHDQPVTVTKAVASCGCTIPTWPKDPIPAGGFAEAEITLKPPEKQGVDLHKRVTFQLDGFSPVVLDLKGHVTEYIKVSPELIDGPGKTPSADGGSSGEIVLTAVDGKPFKILSANPPLVKDLSSEAQTEHKVHIDWGTWAESGKSPKLAFTTDHPKATTLTVIIKRRVDDIKPPEVTPKPAAPANPVIQAVRAGDLATLKILIANGQDVNTPDAVSGGRTALHWAVKEGKKDMIPVLLEAKANVEAKDRVGKTPLTFAAEGRDLDIVKMLVEAGADVNARDQIGGSPVLWASGLGNPEVVKYLITKKADVNVVDVNGLSPLLWAAGIGSPDAVNALIGAGAQVDVADKMSGDTALMRASRTGRIESVKALIAAKANVNSKNNLGHTPFMLAAMSGNVEKLETLKAAGADFAAKDVRGWNALDYANNRIDAEKSKVVAYLGGFVPQSGAIASPEATPSPKTTPAGDTGSAPAVPATGAK